MLIEDYDLEVTSVPCEPGSEEFAAIVRLNVDIGLTLPYLNRTLRGAVYNHQAPSLAWKKGGRNIAFWPYKIAIGHLEDRAQAQKVVQGLVNLVNRTWARREEIEPDYEMHRRPGPLEVYKLLPQTNCRACEQPTCYTFACKLVIGRVKLEACLRQVGRGKVKEMRSMAYKELGQQVEALQRRLTPAFIEGAVGGLMRQGEDVGGGVNAFRLVKHLLGNPQLRDVEVTWAYDHLKPALRSALERIPSLYYFEGD